MYKAVQNTRVDIYKKTTNNHYSIIKSKSRLIFFLQKPKIRGIRLPRIQRQASDNFTCCHAETERGDHDFCLSPSHYTDINQTTRERAGQNGDRTNVLLTMSRALYRLSYIPLPFFFFFQGELEKHRKRCTKECQLQT